jgi:carbon monoxide dehydrogenase subunit G
MALQTTGEIVVEVDRPTAFDFVSDPARLARCIPGCRDLQDLGEGRYAAVMSGKVAYLTLNFKVIIEVVRIQAPELIEATIAGNAVALPGRVTASAGLQLFEIGERRTGIRYVTDVALTGRIGGFGEPVFKATSVKLAQEFAANLKTAIEGGGREAHI